MKNAVMEEVVNADIFISAAAISDYCPVRTNLRKIKKDKRSFVLELEPTVDILSEVSSLELTLFCVGFAAETNDILEYAKGKLQNKKLDMIVANQVGNGIGFDSDENQVVVLKRDHEPIEFKRNTKKYLARKIISLIHEAMSGFES